MDVIMSYIDKGLGALSSFNFMSDLLDVLLVAFVIYEGIKIIRGSRTFQVVKGIALLFIVFTIVKIANMEASEFLLGTLFENGLIILVVLFAPDLRSVLERFGRQSIKDFFNFNFRNESEHKRVLSDTVNDFCKAADDMSSTCTGALVVFEKNSLLKDIAQTGTMVDAKSSPELFNSLFFKNSALHDGAVVVRDGKIYSAGCILPLTQNSALATDLGTRHRAAIGITENTDAVAVVVSEETGSISIAKNGELTRDISTGSLREMLLSELVVTVTDETSSPKKAKKSRKEKHNEEEKLDK